MKQYIAFILDNNRSGVVKHQIGNDVDFDIESHFMKELRRNLFAGTEDEDVHEHVRRVLEIADLFHIFGITHDAIMLRVFPITLTGATRNWKNMLPAGSITTWDLLEREFIWKYCPLFKTARTLEEIRNFKQGMDETLYQAWERFSKETDEDERSCVMKINVELETFIQQLNPLYKVSQSSKLSTKTGVKRREMKYPLGSYNQMVDARDHFS
ncbi:ribonuclease H-like domain-containing protein [Tanacetum coccineum]